MMADLETNSLTVESLKQYLRDLTELRDLDKMTEIIHNVISDG